MRSFAYHRPASVSEAVQLQAAVSDATYLAGGHTLIPAMKLRLLVPGALIDVSRLEELRGIHVDRDRLIIGAATTHAELASSAAVLKRVPALAHLAGSIGDPAVRNRGTLGGSVANNDPAADYPSAVLALDAVIHTDRRTLPAPDYFTGMYSTALEPGELITRIAFIVPQEAAYAKFRSAGSRFAIAAVFVARFADGRVQVAVTGAGQNGVFRAESIEAALRRHFSPGALEGIAIDPANLNSDPSGSAEYRAQLIKVLAARAVTRPGTATLLP